MCSRGWSDGRATDCVSAARPDALRGDVDELVQRILAMDADAVRQCKAYFQAAHGGALDDNFARATDLLTARTLQLLARRG